MKLRTIQDMINYCEYYLFKYNGDLIINNLIIPEDKLSLFGKLEFSKDQLIKDEGNFYILEHELWRTIIHKSWIEH